MTEPTATADLPSITNKFWVVKADSFAHKAELFDYAAKAGVPASNNHPDDRDLSIGSWEGKLLAYCHDFNPDGSSWDEQYRVLEPEQFKAMCDAYAATRHTAPAAPHGVRDLLLGLVFALLFSALLPSCAGPARLPERPVVQHAAHDSRTKLAEPTPSRIR
jgi:hypothetical protein